MTQDYERTWILGRIAALEVLNVAQLTSYFAESFDNPVQALDSARHSVMSSQQNIRRPVTEEADAIWAAMIDALNEAFDNVRIRLGENPRR